LQSAAKPSLTRVNSSAKRISNGAVPVPGIATASALEAEVSRGNVDTFVLM
jgi:hypothetical protein